MAPQTRSPPSQPPVGPMTVDELLATEPDILSQPQEDRLQAAIQLSKNNPSLSQRKLAEDLHVPRSTLGLRLAGGKTRQEAHVHQMKLTPEQEEVLSDWVKVMGRRGLPITPRVLRDYASKISETEVGESWSKRFMKRHPELTTRYTRSLEECRARALNPTTVGEWFDLLQEIITEYEIRPENIWNMDEKGIQLGVGHRVTALVDREQKDVIQVESGNRELVTVIEAVCADGSRMRPSVIFQGKRRRLSWQENNPCEASVSISENGWTDQELGSLWLEKDFHPFTAARNPSNGYRLLILDGHNSHCSFEFIDFAANHHIIILCLPSHTTHALQPCDVGVFSPLSKAWKNEVVDAARSYATLTKDNLLVHYHRARQKAFKPETIQSAFRKCGIWPLDRNAIPPEAFIPSHTTSTQSHPILPIELPSLLVPIPDVPPPGEESNMVPEDVPSETSISDQLASLTLPSGGSSTSTSTTALTTTTNDATASANNMLGNQAAVTPLPTTYMVVGLPPRLPAYASREALQKQNDDLRQLVQATSSQVSRDYAHKLLLQDENDKLRARLFTKKKPKRTDLGDHPRHLTSEEGQEALKLRKRKDEREELFKEIKVAGKAYEKRAETRRQQKAKEEVEKKRQQAREDAEGKRRQAKEQTEEKRRQAKEKAGEKKRLAAEEVARRKAEREAEKTRKALAREQAKQASNRKTTAAPRRRLSTAKKTHTTATKKQTPSQSRRTNTPFAATFIPELSEDGSSSGDESMSDSDNPLSSVARMMELPPSSPPHQPQPQPQPRFRQKLLPASPAQPPTVISTLVEANTQQGPAGQPVSTEEAAGPVRRQNPRRTSRK